MVRAQNQNTLAGTPGPRLVELTANLQKVLPADTKTAWRELVPVLPKALYLCGGTAVATHLGHRKSRDLDLFYHRHDVDLATLKAALVKTGKFSVEAEGAGTLRGYYGATKLDILHADQPKPQKMLEPPTVISGLRIAGLSDLAAMKVNAIGGRGQLRDYFDLKVIEDQGGISIEDALAHYLARYQVDVAHESVRHILTAMGYLGDVDADKLVPIKKKDLEGWWKARQRSLIRNLGY